MKIETGTTGGDRIPSLRQAVETALSLAIRPALQEALNLPHPIPNPPPLKWIGRGSRIIYGSAIALHTAQPDQAISLAEAIATQFHRSFVQTASWSARLAQEWTIFPVPPGLLQFHLSDRGTALWLQAVVDWLPPPPPRLTLSSSDASLFCLQSTHARCCTLLQLAHQEGIAPLLFPPAPVQTATETLSQALSAPIAALPLQHPTEQALLESLLTTLDNLPEPQNPLKQAIALSQTFQDFHAACRLFDPTKQSDRPLVQARLSLTLATQKILRYLLEGMGVEAPVEL